MNLINKNSCLISLYKNIIKHKIIFIDTEFERSKTFYPVLCLIQISVNKKIFFIDALSKNLNLKIIKKILENKNITKVFHSCLQDCYVFIDIFHKKIKFNNIHDTQLMANICGCEKNISYANMIKYTLDIEIDKENRRSNWLQRPLSIEQVEYAKNDVLYLALSYEKLLKQIAKQHNLNQLKDESNSLNKNLNSLIKNYNPYKKFSFKNKSYSYVKKLKKIIDYRDKLAKNLNKPRSFIIEDKLINLLLKSSPKSIHQINKLSRNRRIHSKMKIKILHIIHQKEGIFTKFIKYFCK